MLEKGGKRKRQGNKGKVTDKGHWHYMGHDKADQSADQRDADHGKADHHKADQSDANQSDADRSQAYVDTYVLARLGRELAGRLDIARFERLLGDLPPQGESEVSWSLRGETDAHGQRFLHVDVTASPLLMCQRCMQPFVFPVRVGNRLQLVASEADLDPEGGLDDDDTPERIVGSQRFDVMGLVEDEIILALPYVPKHDVCPSLPAALDADSDTGRPSPFSVLSQLKKN